LGLATGEGDYFTRLIERKRLMIGKEVSEVRRQLIETDKMRIV